MAYNKEELIKLSIEAIESKNLFFLQDVIAYLPCSSATFYNQELEKVEAIKEALAENKVKVKNALRKKWFDNDQPTTQIALYKLLANREELIALTNQTVSGDSDNPVSLSNFNIIIEKQDE